MRPPLGSTALRLVSLPAFLLATGALPVVGETGDAPYYFEGDRRVVYVREPAAPGEALTPVRLRWEGRSVEVRAFVDRTAVVTLEPGGEARVAELGGVLVRPLMPSAGLWLAEDISGGDGLDLARRLRGELERGRGIRGAVPNLHVRRKPMGAFTPDDPKLPGQWYFANLKMPDAWGMTQGDSSTSVVVIDTGCDLQHPELVSKLDPGRDVVDGDDDPSPHTDEPGAAHGTSCAGLVAAATNNGVGIAGACPACRLRCVRLLSDAPVPISADVEAFQFALDTNAAVVSNSWGFVDPMPVPKPLETAIDEVFDNGRGGKGALVLFAMGNDDRVVGDDEMEAVRGALAIGAINNLDQATPFTNSGNAVDLVAYTGTVTTDIRGPEGEDPGDYTTLFGGTSSSCPVVAGIAGLLASAAPEKTSQELYDVLIKTARPAPEALPDADGHDPVFGYGIVDPVKALQDVLGIEPPDTSVDAGSGDDAGTGGDDATPVTPEEKGGCACRAAPVSETGAAWAAALALVLLRSRKKSPRS